MSGEALGEKLVNDCTALDCERIPHEVIAAAKLHILDTLGCLLAGSRLEAGKLAYELASEMGGGSPTATLFGSTGRAAYLDAVRAMSVAAHCGEMDDIHSRAGTCIGAMIVPALTATAEKYPAPGRRFLEAAIAGYETIARVGLSIDAPKLFARGWWPSTVCGAFGVAAACVKFLGWPAEKAANALGIAALFTGGMITGGNEGATARHLGFGQAAQNGVLALQAAEKGFAGPRRALEDPRGFCLTLCENPRWEYLQEADRFHLLDVAFKPYPCARQLHASVEALLTLLRHHAISPDAIEAVDLDVPGASATMVNRPEMVASHAATVASGQYVMAVTALRGKMDLTSFEAELLHSDRVQSLMRRVTVRAAADLDRHFPKYWPGRVTVKITGGSAFTHEVIIPKGEAGNPMSREEIEEKFLSLAAPVLGGDKATAVLQEVDSLDRQDSVEPLLTALKI